MQISVSNLTQLTIPDLAAFDLDPGLGLACLQVEGDNIAVFLNGKLTRSWRQGGHWKPRAIKWLSSDEVITYPDVAVVSAHSWRDLERSGPHIFVIAERFMLLGYGEEQIYGAYLDDPESKWASVYSRSGKLEFGFRELFYANREANIAEIEACYSVGDSFIFVSDDLHFNKVWVLDAHTRTYRSITTPFDLVTVHVMAGDDKKAYAIFDNRYLSQHYPDLPPFELAVFDLVAGTAIKSSFAPVEAALLAAGFDPAAISLQPNARGRIIVSDATKAALLEFSDGD